MDNILEKLNVIERNSLLAAKNVLCLEDVAVLTGLSKSTIYKLTADKKIPHYKPNGKLVYFERTEIENWMLQNRVGTTDEAEQNAMSYLIRKGIER
jgi:excisionase family DNA binding protein